jgi:ribose transport system substrate-binding protein
MHSSITDAVISAFLALTASAVFAANTTGPNGKSATPASNVTLTPEEEASALARAAAAVLIEQKLPPFLAVDALAVTEDNLKEGWQQSLHRDPPASPSEAQ